MDEVKVLDKGQIQNEPPGLSSEFAPLWSIRGKAWLPEVIVTGDEATTTRSNPVIQCFSLLILQDNMKLILKNIDALQAFRNLDDQRHKGQEDEGPL